MIVCQLLLPIMSDKKLQIIVQDKNNKIVETLILDNMEDYHYIRECIVKKNKERKEYQKMIVEKCKYVYR